MFYLTPPLPSPLFNKEFLPPGQCFERVDAYMVAVKLRKEGNDLDYYYYCYCYCC